MMSLNDRRVPENVPKLVPVMRIASLSVKPSGSGSFADYLWSFTDGRTLRPRAARSWKQVPTRSRESDAMSKDLQARGFRFVGTTICYAFMQAVGMVDDHLASCFRFQLRR